MVCAAPRPARARTRRPLRRSARRLSRSVRTLPPTSNATNRCRSFCGYGFSPARRSCSCTESTLELAARDAARDVSIQRAAYPGATSAVIADRLVADATSPSQRVARDEMLRRLEDALNDMDEMDREVLVLRHFEQLTGKEDRPKSSASRRGRRTSVTSDRWSDSESCSVRWAARALRELRRA